MECCDLHVSLNTVLLTAAMTLLCVSLKAERDGVHVMQEEQLGSFLELQQQLAAAKAAMRTVVNQPRHILPFLQPGRLVNVAARASGMYIPSQTIS